MVLPILSLGIALGDPLLSSPFQGEGRGGIGRASSSLVMTHQRSSRASSP
jgi:hypothetical protein